MNNIKVIKFGGTSLKTFDDRKKVINIIKKENEEHHLVIVVSAMGRFPDPYATDTLLKKVPLLDLKSKDEMLSCGEIISSHCLCNECIDEGLDCCCISILENGINTNEDYGEGCVLHVDSNHIYEALKEHSIVIVPGFFGTNKYSYPTSLGRGGSDLSAVLIAFGLQLKEVTIYSDVEGIFSADPKKISTATLYPHVNINQAILLGSLNVAVIQKKACVFAKKHHIKMILKSTFRTLGQTIIDDSIESCDFLIANENGYFVLNKYNQLVSFTSKLTLKDAHELFIE